MGVNDFFPLTYFKWAAPISFISLESLDTVPWNHVLTFPWFLLQRVWEEGGSEKRALKMGIVSNFCLRKILPFPWGRQDLYAVKRVPGQLPEVPNLKSNSIYFLAFQRAVSDGDRLAVRASASALWLCSLSSAFQNMKWLFQEMHMHPFWCHTSLRPDLYFKENLKRAKPQLTATMTNSLGL